MVLSNSLQSMRLFYDSEIATKKIAYIFVNTECNGFKYNNTENRSQHAINLFQNILQFKKVHIFQNLAKSQIIEKLDVIQVFAKKFVKKQEDK